MLFISKLLPHTTQIRRGATITAEVPNGSIHRFNGFLGIPDGSQPANHNHGGMGSSTTRLSHSSGGSLSTVSPGSKSGGEYGTKALS